MTVPRSDRTAGDARNVHLAGVALAVVAESSDLERCLDWLIGGAPPTTAVPELHLTLSATAPALPARPADDRISSMRLWFDDHDLRCDHDLGMSCQVSGSEIRVGGDLRLPLLWRAVRQLAVPALTAALVPFGLTVVHGAAIAKDGTAVMLLGPSGSGKSTLMAAALDEGWEALADDLVAVRVAPGDGGLLVSGLPRRASLPSELISDRWLEGSIAMPGDERGRWMLPDRVLSVGWRPLREFVVLSGEGPSEVSPLEAEDRRRWVLSSFLLSESPVHLRGCFSTLITLGGLPGFRLGRGADAGAEPADAVALLDRIRSGRPESRMDQ
ncbi:MAG: hypothetical protein OEU32_10285 [Acidimicrobiia bacterium]|nr:hypothetical protein [Acidimicrobiia bacterium]